MRCHLGRRTSETRCLSARAEIFKCQSHTCWRSLQRERHNSSLLILRLLREPTLSPRLASARDVHCQIGEKQVRQALSALLSVLSAPPPRSIASTIVQATCIDKFFALLSARDRLRTVCTVRSQPLDSYNMTSGYAMSCILLAALAMKAGAQAPAPAVRRCLLCGLTTCGLSCILLE